MERCVCFREIHWISGFNCAVKKNFNIWGETLCLEFAFYVPLLEVFFFFNSTNFLTLQEYLEFRKERAKMLLSRQNQLLLEFSFWNEPQPRRGPNIYELRTYNLKVSLPAGRFSTLFCTFIHIVQKMLENFNFMTYLVCYVIKSKLIPWLFYSWIISVSKVFNLCVFQPGTMIEWGNRW